jgi:hypothetical protein
MAAYRLGVLSDEHCLRSLPRLDLASGLRDIGEAAATGDDAKLVACVRVPVGGIAALADRARMAVAHFSWRRGLGFSGHESEASG